MQPSRTCQDASSAASSSTHEETVKWQTTKAEIIATLQFAS